MSGDPWIETSVCRHAGCGLRIIRIALESGIGTKWTHQKADGEEVHWYCRTTVAGPTVDIHS